MPPTRSPQRTLTAILAGAIVALPVAGCGKSTTKTTSAATPASTTTRAADTNAAGSEPLNAPAVKIARGTPLTHARWVAKANAVCAHYYPSLNVKIKGFDELPRALPQQSAYLHQEIQQLAKLTPPQPNRREWQELLNTLMQWAQRDIQLAQHPGPGSSSLRTPIGEALLTTSKHAIELAQHNHLTHCAGE